MHLLPFEKTGGLRVAALRQAGVGAHVWARKEIENYLLVPEAIEAVVAQKTAKRTSALKRVTRDDVGQRMLAIATTHQEEVRGQMLARVLLEKRASGEDMSTTIVNFNREFDRAWVDPAFVMAVSPGKAILSELNSWLQSEQGASVTAREILNNLPPHLIADEVEEVMKDILSAAR